MELEFYGAAGEVTGSCHVVRVGARRILLDCGLIQGSRRDEARNRAPFPFDPRAIDAVVLSHAHIDHSGRLPLLVKRGYSGPIYAQAATRDLCSILLNDAAELGERDTESENRKRDRKGLDRLEPLYTVGDAEQACRQVRGLPYGSRVEIAPGVTIRFRDAGHIMGSAVTELWASDTGSVSRKLVFSGDLGQYGTPILRDPETIEEADLVVMECTYGDRRHRAREATFAELAAILSAADHERGNVLIPAFAVGRSQELLYVLSKHYSEWNLDRWKIFLDSPMAIAASAIYAQHAHLFDEDASSLGAGRERGGLLPNLVLSRSPQDSMRINERPHGAIVIAGSGMCTGGRILHHLKHNVWRPECHVVIVGYQAQGTLGRKLVDAEQYVRIHHETIRVQAQVHTVGGLSAHGDQEDLARWYRGFAGRPPAYLVHGEARAAQGLSVRLTREGAAEVVRPEPGTVVSV
jgi:metallo-beta-lactamase family protein